VWVIFCWYIFPRFGIFTKKNLATLEITRKKLPLDWPAGVVGSSGSGHSKPSSEVVAFGVVVVDVVAVVVVAVVVADVDGVSGVSSAVSSYSGL
jgi:hypothetical protein